MKNQRAMKRLRLIKASLALSVAACSLSVQAKLNVPSEGSDGPLNITSNTVIDLSQAVAGTWSDTNSPVGLGIYDSNKWAVVFKYSSVNIALNATVTFKNHPTHAPVVWLVNGSVTINGTLNLDGQSQTTDTVALPEPGPGGFRGGARSQGALGIGSGFGPGGGDYQDSGGYADYHAYGDPQIVPLIGGSGGSAWSVYNAGAGGGAILIASADTVTLEGTITAFGGFGPNSSSGSGGAVRIMADQIQGTGRIDAGSPIHTGRIRLEANNVSSQLSLNPPTTVVVPTPLVIWPDASAPVVRVVSVAAQSAPTDPKAAMSVSGDDLTIGTTNAVVIELQTANFPVNGIVNVYIKPRNAEQAILPASYVSGNSTLATWQLNTVLPVGHTVIQARAVSN
jgi:hypothetical protein